ncbi:MAG: hypothetical protein Q4F53_04700 [Nesterenkonia sp.]|nr:hypothetical protein [Nesterenkonia sp.]
MSSRSMVPSEGAEQGISSAAERRTSGRRSVGGGKKAAQRGKHRRKPTLMRTAATGLVTQQALGVVSKRAFDEDGRLTPSAESWLIRAVTVQRPIVLANLRRLRKAHPTLTNRQLAQQLDKEFSRLMTGSGALIGATAAVPAVGTVASLGISAAATGGFLETCALYAQSMAELSGVSTEDPTRAQALVMGVMLGEEGRRLLGELNDQAGGRGTGPYSTLVPLNSLSSGSGVGGVVFNQLKKQFVRRFFVRQGTSMVARAIPFGIGAVVGGAANRMLARQIVRTAHKTFGELPEETPQALVEDMRRGLEREQHRADRRERREKKKGLKAEQKQIRQRRRAQEILEKGDEAEVPAEDADAPDASAESEIPEDSDTGR